MKEIIGERIRKLREEHSLTQDDVATKLGISRQKLARIEKGQNDISFDTIVKLSEIFKVNYTEITNAIANQPCEAFRSGGNSNNSFAKVEEIVDMFFANRKLYYNMNISEGDD